MARSNRDRIGERRSGPAQPPLAREYAVQFALGVGARGELAALDAFGVAAVDAGSTSNEPSRR